MSSSSAVAARVPLHDGTITGAVVWAGPYPKFPHRDCDLHAFDVEGHPEITTGLADVVVIAEPLDPDARRWLRKQPAEGDSNVAWAEGLPERVATVAPGTPLKIENQEEHALKLRFFRGTVLLQMLDIQVGEEKSVRDLPEGRVRIVDEVTGIVGWVQVTPYPAKVSYGNCRFGFHGLPQGHYLLRGWHPRAGESARHVYVRNRQRIHRVQLLLFGRSDMHDNNTDRCRQVPLSGCGSSMVPPMVCPSVSPLLAVG